MRKLITTLIGLSFWSLLCGFTVIGHRGAPLQAPEETFASFNSAFAQGADYVELDLHVSKDNVLVISHDRNLARISGHNAIVSQTPWSLIKTFKQANGEPLHSLDELFATYQNRPQTKFLIETKKTKKGTPQNMEALLTATIKKYHMEDRVMVHSFSLKSLQNMQKMLPAIPRIFIAGTLKKINFQVLQTATGINISSKLATPTLVRQLQQLKQKVYIWDEMDEEAQQWQWLINLPIDGVVTNYPQTGYHYQQQKATAQIKEQQFSGRLVSLYPTLSYENPYQPSQIKQKASPFKNYQVQSIVKHQGQIFLQIGANRFIDAAGFNNQSDLPLTQPYLGQKLCFKTTATPWSKQPAIYQDPFGGPKITQRLNDHRSYRIQAVQKQKQTLWFKIAAGWVSAQDVLVSFDRHSQGWQAYQALNKQERLATPALNSTVMSLITTPTLGKN